jgi:hypothetical protein
MTIDGDWLELPCGEEPCDGLLFDTVLVPECIIRVVQQRYRCTYEEAEKRCEQFTNGDGHWLESIFKMRTAYCRMAHNQVRLEQREN